MVRFYGSRVQATLAGGRYFTVVLDGQVQPEPLVVSEIEKTYELVSGLPKGEHLVEVHRRTEGRFGPTLVRDIQVDGELLPVPRPSLQIEVVGDSGVTGYGIEGSGPDCRFSAETQNHHLTWNAITARALNAELSTVAWSGKGAIFNYGTDRSEPMPAFYDRVIATEAGSEGVIRPADLVLVALGANDYSTEADPDEDEFVSAYVGLLERIRARHPGASILAIFPRMNDPDDTERARVAIESAVELRRVADDARVEGVDLEPSEAIDFGCDYHFGIQSHAAAAEHVIDFLTAKLDG